MIKLVLPLLSVLILVSIPAWSQDDMLMPWDMEEEAPETSPQESTSEEDTVVEETDDFFPPGEAERQESTEQSSNTPTNEQQQQPSFNEYTPPSEPDSSLSSGTVGTDEFRGTQRITFSGSLGFNYVFREDLFADSTLGINSTNLDGDFFDPRLSLRFDVQIANNILGIFELQNESRIEQFHVTTLGNLHITNRSEDNAFELELERAYIQANDFLVTGLQLKGGIIPLRYALRANGDAFFIDLGEAESPFGIDVQDGEDVNARGFMASWQPAQVLELYIEPFYFVTSETGFLRQDEAIMGLNIDFDMSKVVTNADESQTTLVRFFNLVFAGIEGDNRQPLWSVGFGFDYFVSGSPDKYILELYGEALFQIGELNRKNLSPGFGVKDQDHLAFGGYLGARYKYEKSEWKPFVDVSFWYITGDDDDPNRDVNTDLITYEDVDSTLIVEDNDYGFDIDSNYWAVKFQSGISLKPLVKEEMRFEVLYAHFESIDAPPGQSNRMGEEIDLRLVWEYSSDLTFILAAGLLFNSPFFKEVFDEVGADGRQSAFLLRFETLLRF